MYFIHIIGELHSDPSNNCSPVNGGGSVAVTGSQGTITYAWVAARRQTEHYQWKDSRFTYTVTVTDDISIGCTATCQAVIADNSAIPPVTCAKRTTILTVPTKWKRHRDFCGCDICMVKWWYYSYNFNLSAGTYTVTVTNTTTACTKCLANSRG